MGNYAHKRPPLFLTLEFIGGGSSTPSPFLPSGRYAAGDFRAACPRHAALSFQQAPLMHDAIRAAALFSSSSVCVAAKATRRRALPFATVG